MKTRIFIFILLGLISYSAKSQTEIYNLDVLNSDKPFYDRESIEIIDNNRYWDVDEFSIKKEHLYHDNILRATNDESTYCPYCDETNVVNGACTVCTYRDDNQSGLGTRAIPLSSGISGLLLLAGTYFLSVLLRKKLLLFRKREEPIV